MINHYEIEELREMRIACAVGFFLLAIALGLVLVVGITLGTLQRPVQFKAVCQNVDGGDVCTITME